MSIYPAIHGYGEFPETLYHSGATKPALTPLSEAQSYLNLALARGLLDSTDALLNETVSLKDRMFLDEFATDSYQNVLFPLLQFPRYLQSLSLSPRQPLTPGRLIIVSHDFKRRRFTELHLPAIKFPVARTEYVGIDPVFDQDEDKGERRRRDITEGDLKRGFGAWKEDLYGDGEVLSAKRRVRGWSGVRMNDLLEQCASGKEGDKRREMIQRLLTWRGGDNRKEIFPERLPWEQDEVMARV